MIFRSIKIKIVVFQVVLVSFAVFSMWILSYLLMVDHFTMYQKTNLQNFADFKKSELEHYFSEIKVLMERTADSREFKDFHITNKNMLLVELFTKSKQMFSTLTYVDKEGQEELRVAKDRLSERILNSISKNPTFHDSLRQHNKVVISPVTYSDELNEPVIFFMLSKYLYFADEFAGTLVGSVPVYQLGKRIEDKIGESGFVSLIDNNGIVLFHPKKDKISAKIIGQGEQAKKLIADCKNLKAGFRKANILGLEGFVAYAPFEETGWSILVTLPSREFLAESNQLRRITAVIFIIILALSMIISLNLAKGITDPILKLVAVVNVIAQGDFCKRAQVHAKDEIGQLAGVFNTMTEHLQKTTVSRDELVKEVNERKKTEEALKQEKAYVEFILNSVQSGIVLIDAETYTIAYVNPVAIEAIGAPKEKIIGSICHKYICPAEEGKCPIIDLHQQVDNSERVLIKANGDRLPVLKTVVPITLRNRKFLLESFMDITKRKRAEEELKKAYKKLEETQDQLIQSEKLNAVGQLASGVAHEVRNPLGIIMLGVDYLEKKISATEGDVFETLTGLKDSVKRADKIINALLDFSRAASLYLQPEDVNSILEVSLSLLKARFKFENIDIIIETKKDMPKALADKNRLEQVFINILLNAVQAMPQGGKIIIRSYDKQLEEVKNGIGRRDSDHFKIGEEAVIVEIEDTGIGIPKESLKKVFDPFFTTKGPTGGAGLGLSVSRNIITMHKGLIDVKSQIGKGTKVRITLKIARVE